MKKAVAIISDYWLKRLDVVVMQPNFNMIKKFGDAEYPGVIISMIWEWDEDTYYFFVLYRDNDTEHISMSDLIFDEDITLLGAF